MKWHLALYSALIASASVNQTLAAIGDPIMAPAGNGLLVSPDVNKLLRVISVGNILVRAGLTSASIREFIAQYDFSPVNVGTILESPLRMGDVKETPFTLTGGEELDVVVTNSAATSTRTTVAVIVGDGPIVPAKGQIFSVHWTTTQALAAAAFQNFTPTLDNGLPSGQFALVGARVRSATGLFFRIIPRGGGPFRPGGPMYQAADDGGPMNWFRNGEMGEWMRFSNTTPPQVECFAISADAANSVDGYFDLIQVA